MLLSKQLSIKTFGLSLLIIMFISFAFSVSASETVGVKGKVFSFEEDSAYEFSNIKNYSDSDKTNTYGEFFLKGQFSDISSKDCIPTYQINDEKLEIFYSYDDELLNAAESSWHLVEDKSKVVDNKKLNSKIMKGAIILQISKDRINWTDVFCKTDVFNEKPNNSESIYEAKPVELLNGCYYRLVVAYNLGKAVETDKILFFDVDKYEYSKIAEVYEFYAISAMTGNEDNSSNKYQLGKKEKVENEGYSEIEEMKENDPHYGWEIGHFFVSGYTADKMHDGKLIFLKNVGDKVTLSFVLNQNINSLNNNPDLYISFDDENFDQDFEIVKQAFGKGTLIIEYRNKADPAECRVYTNYLEANTKVGADTIVQICEEGDYRIALDYEITNKRFLSKKTHYKIYFEFSVRNGNCMVFPMDAETKSELLNSSYAPNGFYIDLTRSLYLQLFVKREMLTESADGLVEDTRYNRPAKDGEKFLEDGIYTIKVKNIYTEQETEKKIYVGDDLVLRAYVTTGKTISEINSLVAKGVSISETGELIYPDNFANEETTDESSSVVDIVDSDSINMDSTVVPVVFLGLFAGFCIVTLLVIIKLNKRKERT